MVARAIKEPCRSVHIPKAVLATLSPAAKKRGLNAETLVYLLIDRIAEDGIVDAVLDDAGHDYHTGVAA